MKKKYLKYIAVLDKKDRIHSVEFYEGVNVITGRSSTGKSAMIEIFDYCFGSSEDTIPKGIITENTKIYFIVFVIGGIHLILARRPDNSKMFLREEIEITSISNFNYEFFSEKYFLPKEDFRKTLGLYFGLNIDDTETDLNDKIYTKRKSPRPSVRNFTSFMLQHQNLVANKHALFYRFDEKEKREQTIDQFKIFAGFVKQDYFIKKQKLSELERELKISEIKQKSLQSIQEEHIILLDELLNEYLAITGNALIKKSANDLVINTADSLDKIKNSKVIVDPTSSEYLNLLSKFEEERILY